MNTPKRLLKTLALGAMAFGFAITLAAWRGGRTASAQEAAPQRSQSGVATLFGMQTLAPRQTAQITVVNPSEIIPCVRVRLTFDIYEIGSPDTTPELARLRFVRSVSREVELDPGEAVSFAYTANARGEFVSPASFALEEDETDDPYKPARAGERNPPTIRTRALAATSTLLIHERGRALFTPPGVRMGFDPQPDPPH